MLFDLRMRPTVAQMVIDEAGLQGVPAHLALGVAWRESRFDPLAVSPKGAMGVMQLMPHTARVLHVQHPLDARQSAIAGVGLLAFWLEACGSEHAALQAYAKGRCPK
jgi:soluble lytic murein transglycosylase-like protein